MNNTFDAVAWMRKRRTEIDEETKGLSWQERGRKVEEALKGDPLWERLKDTTVAPLLLCSPVPPK